MKPIASEKSTWHGQLWQSELYPDPNYKNLKPITQVQAVCFPDPDHVVLFENAEGRFGLPGGTIEEGESPESALVREVREEASLKLLDWTPIAYIKAWPLNHPEKIECHLRTAARVELLNESIQDPDHKAVARKVVPISKAAAQLDWGQKGEALINLAYQEISKLFDGQRPPQKLEAKE